MPAWSPVKGRPVRFAPRIPGASPTISSRARSGPKGATGRACQSGCRAVISARKRASLGQSRQRGSYPGCACGSGFVPAGICYKIPRFCGELTKRRIMAKVLATEIRVGHLLEWEKRIWRVLKCYHVHVGGRGGGFLHVGRKDLRGGPKTHPTSRTPGKVAGALVASPRTRALYHDRTRYVFL